MITDYKPLTVEQIYAIPGRWESGINFARTLEQAAIENYQVQQNAQVAKDALIGQAVRRLFNALQDSPKSFLRQVDRVLKDADADISTAKGE